MGGFSHQGHSDDVSSVWLLLEEGSGVPQIMDVASNHAPSPNGLETSNRDVRNGLRCSPVRCSASVGKVEEREKRRG
jgi:hypothetical protein